MRLIWGGLLLASLLGEVAADGESWRTKVKVIRNGVYPLDLVDKLEESTMSKVESYMTQRATAGMNNNCTLENAAVRREWGDMSIEDRLDYIRATNCLMKLPPKAPKDQFPGALSRFDDFVAYHMTHAAELHNNFNLFPAHKYFLYAYEQALRNECGYKRYQPYMNYDRLANDPINSAMFNGNESSMGGNGEPDPAYKGIPQNGRTPNIIKSGGGGGCVKSGPFSEFYGGQSRTRIATSPSIPKNPQTNGQGVNRRCLRRDINRNAAMGATADRMFALIDGSKDIDTFYNTLLGTPPPKNDPYPWGIHTAGHYIHAVDPSGDPATSPGDPVFYFHHGALDRLWWIWQMQDPATRLNQVPFYKDPSAAPSHNHGGRRSVRPELRHQAERRQGRVTDPNKMMIDLLWLAPPIKLFEAHDQLGGNGGTFCYVYV